MRINNNIMAMNTHRQFGINSNNVAKATERLSSGYRINRAGDDAAGLAISEKMRAQIRGLNMASKNSQDAISLVQTAEGALTETHSILQRMRELSVQSSSDTNQDTTDREALDNEFQALKAEINDIAQKTTFNEKNLLNGTFGASVAVDAGSGIEVGLLAVDSIELSGFEVGANQTITFGAVANAGDAYSAVFDGVTVSGLTNLDATAGTLTMDFGDSRIATIKFTNATTQDDLSGLTLDFSVTQQAGKIQTGANTGETLEISINDMRSTALGIDTDDITDRDKAQTALTNVDAAIKKVSEQRSGLGALQNRLQHKINNLDTSAENLQAAESRIRDLDMAAEMTEFTKNNILVQAATSMLAQANAAPQGVLKLLG